MADEEQLAILKQGVEVWNKWREENPNVAIYLNSAHLFKANLQLADLNEAILQLANLNGADLSGAKLNGAKLNGANLEEAKLIRTNLSKADLTKAYLRGANLEAAKLVRAELYEANLSSAMLSEADLRGARLQSTNLSSAILSKANFLSASFGTTDIGDVDLSKTIGIDEASHYYPSTLGTNTLIRSRGKIPEVFLRGCGLSDWEIEVVKLYDPDLSNDDRNKILYRVYDLQASQAIQISPLFISYSHGDSEFVNKIDKSLTKKGVRFWRDIHDAKAGRLEKQIDRAISQNRTVLLILSQNSLKSDWVEHEVRTARGLEKEMGRDVLCPIALDDSWKLSRWPKRVMEQITEYNILDFSAWEDDVKFEGMFRKLIDGLELFYKG